MFYHIIERTAVFQINAKEKGDYIKEQSSRAEASQIRRNNLRNLSTLQSQPNSVATRKNLIILSPGRGGSSFLGGIFDSSPYVMYWFEPLHTVITEILKADVIKFIEGEEPKNYSQTSVGVINSMFDCDFSNISDLAITAFSNSMFRKRSRAQISGYLCPDKCLPFTRSLLRKACNSYNHTVIKILTDRVPNKVIESLEELFKMTDRYDAKLILLFRDPRALLHSMAESARWITDSPLDSKFRKFVHRVCNPIIQNIRFCLSPPPWLKNRFKVVRYEDLALNTVNTAQELFRFAGIDWSESVEQWIAKHSRGSGKTSARDPYSLYRNASFVINKWKNASEVFIRTVEDTCGDLMDMLGYKKWSKHDKSDIVTVNKDIRYP